MDNDLSTARGYLAAAGETFWKWGEAGRVLTWADGTTIAFREELEQVLRPLAGRGLPPLGAVTLLLAATRDSWGASSREPGMLAGVLVALDGVEGATGKYQRLADVLRRLDGVYRLPGELRSTPAARVALAAVVFEDCPFRTPPAVATEVLRHLHNGPARDFLRRETDSSKSAAAALVRDLHCLARGLDRVDPDTLRTRQRAGLDEPPAPADLDLPPAERTRALLAALEDDDELHGLARLARELMAAVTLPRAVSEPEELPLGGVSDISNRGPLDRLLLSELAHDDLTLAVRVATSEALYLRRERPPRTPPRERILLLEAGLRTWGVPRVFATAVALALAATADAHTSVVAFRAKGDGVVPVDLSTREGLLAHLEALEPEAHPGAALPAFRAALESGTVGADVVLVTAADVLADRDFQQALAAHEMVPLLVAEVRRDGGFQLFSRGQRGSKVLRQAVLDLDKLIAPRPGRALVDRNRPHDLPAIDAVRPFPLRLPHPVEPGHITRVGLGALALTRDGRVMLWDQPHLGARQLATGVPAGAIVWCSPERGPAGGLRLVVGSPSAGRLHHLAVYPDHGQCVFRPLDLTGGHCRGVAHHHGFLFVIHALHVEVFDAASGARRDKVNIPKSGVWRRDRFFLETQDGHWYALGHDGRAGRFERVLAANDERRRRLVGMFEREGVDGPIGVTDEGELLLTATGELRPRRAALQGPLSLIGVSRTGHRIVLGRDVTNSPLPRLWGLEVDTGLLQPLHGPLVHYLDGWRELASPRPLRVHFTGIAATEAGTLVLLTGKGKPLRLEYDPAGHVQLMPHTLPWLGTLHWRNFQPVKPGTGAGWTLSRAEWPDGSRAFLDARGLLHLQSSDRALPEATVVLADGRVGGWCSDGTLWGLTYFTGRPDDRPATGRAYSQVLRSFALRLP